MRSEARLGWRVSPELGAPRHGVRFARDGRPPDAHTYRVPACDWGGRGQPGRGATFAARQAATPHDDGPPAAPGVTPAPTACRQRHGRARGPGPRSRGLPTRHGGQTRGFPDAGRPRSARQRTPCSSGFGRRTRSPWPRLRTYTHIGRCRTGASRRATSRSPARGRPATVPGQPSHSPGVRRAATKMSCSVPRGRHSHRRVGRAVCRGAASPVSETP